MKEILCIPEGKIYCGDSELVLSGFEDNFVDAVITSPPYNISMKYSCYNDSLEHNEYLEKMRRIFSHVYRVLKPDGRLIINLGFAFNNPKTKTVRFVFLDILNILKSIGFMEMDFIVWIKGDENFSVNNNFSNRWGSWMSASRPVMRGDSEGIFVFAKNSYKKLSKGESTITKEEFMLYTKNIWFVKNHNEEKHLAVFPEKLVERILKVYTYKNDLVLDPFAGNGSVGVSSVKNKRRFILIELCEENALIAKSKILNSVSVMF